MLTPAQAVVGSLLVCFAGALGSWLVAKWRRLAGWVAFGAVAVSSGLALYGAQAALLGGPNEPASMVGIAPLGLGLRLHVDGLSAVFIALIAGIAAPAALYSIRYLDHYPDYGVGRYYPNLLLFVAAMYGVVSITDMMWVFLVFWQMMTLPGYALIRFESRRPENIRAANKFLVMMQLACALAMVGAALLAPGGAGAGRYDFDAVSRNLPSLLAQKSGTVAVAFALFLAGFGIKLGMWPFGQMWLPDAHPAAPSPVSAMLSGVMIKTGAYGLMRCFLWLVPLEGQQGFPMAKWGVVIAVLGTVTLFSGTMQALKQEQSKRLLAFHSIGQVGYIMLGLGACLILLPCSDRALAGLAGVSFLGALLHTVNHGTFKSLLFLNAGSMLWATGTQDLNRLGGLMRFMPLTGLTALVAAFSISGVPMFNGFVSKWSIYAGAIQGAKAWPLLPVCAVVAILTSALTLASFIKFFGVSFLSRTSALVAQKAEAAQPRGGVGAGAGGRGELEVGWMMQLPQVLLAGFCLLVGLVPAVAFGWLQRALAASQQGWGIALAKAAPLSNGPLAGVAGLGGRVVLAPLALAVAVGLGLVAAWGLTKLGGARRRAVVPWLCGYAREAEEHRYTAHGFYGELKRYFGWVGGRPKAPGSGGTGGAGDGPAGD